LALDALQLGEVEAAALTEQVEASYWLQGSDVHVRLRIARETNVRRERDVSEFWTTGTGNRNDGGVLPELRKVDVPDSPRIASAAGISQTDDDAGLAVPLRVRTPAGNGGASVP
jgi:hypothetical protein